MSILFGMIIKESSRQVAESARSLSFIFRKSGITSAQACSPMELSMAKS